MVSFGVFGGGFFDSSGIFSNFSMNFGQKSFQGGTFGGFKSFFDIGELFSEIFRGFFF
jgi:hypothetical protein